MRTTIDIEEQVLTVAKERARLQGVTLGTMLTQLIRRGLEPDEKPKFEMRDGIPVLMHSRPPAPVTTDMVRQLLDED